MRAKLLIALFAAALGVAGGWFGGSRTQKPREHIEATQPTQQPANVPLMPPPREPDFTQLAKPTRDVVRIPLDKVYSTSGQKGLNAIPEPPDKSWEEAWKPLFNSLNRSRASNSFLVVAPDIYGAISATRSHYETLLPVEPVDLDDPSKKEPDVGQNLTWLFVFLGSGNEEEGWMLQDIEVENSTVTFRVQRFSERGSFGNPNSWAQLWWVPLPRPESGSQVLIVIKDNSEKPPLVTRRVQIK